MSYYRDRRRAAGTARRRPSRRSAQPRALSQAEKSEILAVLSSDRAADKSVVHWRATLLDEGVRLASQSAMHRLLRERRPPGSASFGTGASVAGERTGALSCDRVYEFRRHARSQPEATR